MPESPDLTQRACADWLCRLIRERHYRRLHVYTTYDSDQALASVVVLLKRGRIITVAFREDDFRAGIWGTGDCTWSEQDRWSHYVFDYYNPIELERLQILIFQRLRNLRVRLSPRTRAHV